MLLKTGETLVTDNGLSMKVIRLLGSGGQGEVYEVGSGDSKYALKWYFPEQASDNQYEVIKNLLSIGNPSPNFLWPLDVISSRKSGSFGYLMNLRPKNYKGVVDLMTRRAEPSFKALCTCGFLLADSYQQLHSKGLCYRDISFGNVFFNPDDGSTMICDVDNVGVTGSSFSGVLGTPRFMAPEIVRGEDLPSADTDRFSLAVLLFYLFMLHHPLEGRKEAAIHSFDLPAMNKLYGFEPLFIFDPDDASNRPVPGLHDNAMVFWPLYPVRFRNLFVRSFTEGLKNPRKGRVMESEWRKALVQLRDGITTCSSCGSENFFDEDKVKAGEPHICWSCNAAIRPPARLCFDRSFVVLNRDTKLYRHHWGDLYNFEETTAEVTQHPQDPNVWGLKNLSDVRWDVTTGAGKSCVVEPGRSVLLEEHIRVNFGTTIGEITMSGSRSSH